MLLHKLLINVIFMIPSTFAIFFSIFWLPNLLSQSLCLHHCNKHSCHKILSKNSSAYHGKCTFTYKIPTKIMTWMPNIIISTSVKFQAVFPQVNNLECYLYLISLSSFAFFHYNLPCVIIWLFPLIITINNNAILMAFFQQRFSQIL